MSLKLRIVLLTLLPLLLMTLAVGLAGHLLSERLATAQGGLLQERLIAAREGELRRLLALAESALAPALAARGRDADQVLKEVRAILTRLSFDTDGYFFLYDAAGVNLAHPIQPELQGRDLSGHRDARGCFVIRELLAVAQQGGGRAYLDQDRRGCYVREVLARDTDQAGGGFLRYLWHRPSTGREDEKLGLVQMLPGYDWMLGTGLYFDDIERDVALARDRAVANVRRSFRWLLALLGATTAGAALLVLFSNLQQGRLADRHLRALARRFVNLQVEERRRFARELHDGIQQSLVAVKYRIDQALAQAAQGKPEYSASLATARANLDDAIAEVRGVAQGLRPALLDRLGLEAALHDLLDDFAEHSGIATRLDYRWRGPRLAADLEITLYRVVQEALTNCRRHAGADAISLTLDGDGALVRLTIRDNGRGLVADATAEGAGLGLRHMRERLELLGGALAVHGPPGQGTTLCATLPAKQPDLEEP